MKKHKLDFESSVYDNYEMYHQERLENAYEDIDTLLSAGKHAWLCYFLHFQTREFINNSLT